MQEPLRKRRVGATWLSYPDPSPPAARRRPPPLEAMESWSEHLPFCSRKSEI